MKPLIATVLAGVALGLSGCSYMTEGGATTYGPASGGGRAIALDDPAIAPANEYQNLRYDPGYNAGFVPPPSPPPPLCAPAASPHECPQTR